MERVQPLFMRTYGKRGRKISAWLSPDNRKQAFESTATSDGDISVFEPAKPTRIKERRTSVASCRAVRLAKRKAMVCLEEEDSDEENINIPSPPPLRPTRQNKTTRKSKLVSTARCLFRQKALQGLITSESEDDSTSAPKRRKIRVQRKINSDVDVPSVGRFVTHRRGAVSSKPKFPKVTVNVLNSSDDFAPRGGASVSRRIPLPSRHPQAPRAFTVSSTENSVNAAGSAGSASNPFREISLNESADHSLGPCTRKPLFCSTPSARPLGKRPHLKPFPIGHQSSTSPSISVSHIGLLSSSQEDVDSPGKPFSPPQSAPVGELSSGEKQQSTLGEPQKEPHHCVEPSGHSVMKQRSMDRSSCSEGAKSQNEATETQNGGEVPSQKLFSLVSSETEGSSHFVSVAGRLEWLVEALKDNCLTQRCTVQLERVDKLTVALLHSQTPYSSCLDHSSSFHSLQSTDHSQSLEQSFHLAVSVNSNESSESSQLVNSCDSTDHAPSGTDSQSIDLSWSVDCNQSAEHTTTKESTEQPASVIGIESTQHTDNSGSVEQTLSSYTGPKDMAVAVKEKCLAKKCTVQLKKMALSQLTVTRQLKELAHHAESGLASDDESVIPEANKSESDHTLDSDHPDGHTHSRKTDKREIASDTQAVYNSRSVDQTQSIDPGSEKREAPLTAMLKEKCLTEKLAVEVKRATLSKQKETVQCKDAALESPTDVSKSESDHTANTHQLNRRRSMKVDMKKRGSANSGDKIASDNEETVRNSRDVVPKRKKASVAPKEKKTRSMSTDRPGTSRKACVSGLSVSRWKNKGNTSTHIFQSRAAQGGRSKVVDCSLNELLSAHHKQPKELHGASVIFSTPVKASRLNLSCLLADLTPDTHTWSRLKAALSVHRKTKVLLTPSSRPMPGFSGRAELADVSQDLFASPLLTPLPERFRSQLLRSASVAVCEEADLSDAEKVCAECGQQGPLPWEECILPQRMKQCAKIGEGTFGEVFSTTNASGDTVALKIIPIEGSEKVNGEDQKTFGEILHEIIISKELSSLKEKQHNQTCGFIGLNDLHCVRGCYPPALLTAWDAFDQQKGSENDRPDFFEKEQLFLILEFEFGGSDLENCNGTLTSLVVAKSILHQVTAALAVAEQELHFEHRDLHWGNVLVKTTKQKKGSFLLNGTAQSLDTRGVLVRIIDYSLSRLEIDGLTVSCDISADEELFMGQGDYQFDIYRLMRQENGNNWSNYQPHSNVLWLHYLCSKLLSMKYRRPGGKGAKDMREELARFHDNILQYRSATEALQNCPMFQ